MKFIIDSAVDCGSPPVGGLNIEETLVSGTTYNSTATYSCELGYQLVPGAVEVNLCNTSGNWTQQFPSDCEGKSTCAKGFPLIGSSNLL